MMIIIIIIVLCNCMILGSLGYMLIAIFWDVVSESLGFAAAVVKGRLLL